VLLKGGREALNTNRILFEIISEATKEVGIIEGWIQLLETRQDVNDMLILNKYIDLLIPRGSNEFVRYIMENTKIPVLGHADGICHCYVDDEADVELVLDAVIDSKTQYVAVCNAMETLLVNENIAKTFLPLVFSKLNELDVDILGCEKTRKFIDVKEAREDDWKTEYLDYILSIKVVKDLDEAIEHINTYGSGHTDSIMTQNMEKAAKFMNMVDSGNVFLNCSTRFSDGFKYGFGAEVGISTTKIHSRGPVGLDGLLIYKYKLIGKGHKVSDYSNKVKTFKHKKMDKDFKI
jgi:glutamate-5-semialdehyde dehydrogenase